MCEGGFPRSSRAAAVRERPARQPLLTSSLPTALMLVLLFSASAGAQVYAPGPQVTTFLSDIDDSDQPYGLYVPKNFDPHKKYPLVISLHGAGSNHRLNLRRVFGRGNRPGENDAEATRVFPQLRDVDFIVASPYARGTMGYQGVAEKDVYDVLADVKSRFPIDDDRIYLTGLSMGGGGALWLAFTRPDIWAAVAPVCPAVPAGAEDLAPNALNIPVHLFHGELDPAVSVEVSRKWYKNLLALDTNVEYVEYPGVRHNSWDSAYRGGAIFDWFSKFRRNRFPDRVRFVSRAYKYDSAYWVRIDGLTPGELASIDARFTGDNQIDVRASGLDGFTLNLEGHPRFSHARVLRITIDGVPHRVKPRDSLSFTKTADAWKIGRYTPPPEAKRPGLEGPIGEAISAHHLYAFGTIDKPGDAELTRRRDEALRAAEWSTPRMRLLVNFRAVPDTEVTPADLRTSNLVLFGTKETNMLIARLSSGLPLELNPGAADYGLIFVAPVDGRYVVIDSGLPWWSGAEQAGRPGVRAAGGAPFAVLYGLGDFVLFKGSLAKVVAEGRFDRDWKLPPDAARKMAATGAVKIR